LRKKDCEKEVGVKYGNREEKRDEFFKRVI
jgi:hypothetical protein